MNAKVGSLNVDVTLETARFEQGVKQTQDGLRAAEAQIRALATRWNISTDSMGRSVQNLGKSSGALRAGMQQLGFQLNDVATQFASGTKASVIFAQQSGQVLQAIQLMAGGTSRFAAFLGGPWGIALSSAAIALSPFISKLFDTKNAADAATGALEELIKKRRQEQAEAIKPTLSAIDLNKLRDQRLILSGRIDKAEQINASERSRTARIGRARGIERLRSQERALNLQIAEGEAAVAAEEAKNEPKPKATPSPRGGSKGGGAAGATGKSAADISHAFDQQLRGIMQRYNDARASMADSADQQAEFELRNVELARKDAIATVQNSKEFNDAQKKLLSERIDELTDVERDRVERKRVRANEDEADRAAQAVAESKRDSLRVQLGLADTEKDRQDIALELYDLDQEEKRQALERIVHSDTRTKAEKALAQVALDTLNGNASAGRVLTQRNSETRSQAFLRSLQQTPEQINEALDGIKIQALDSLNDGLAQAIAGTTRLGDVFKRVAQQIIADFASIAIRKSIIGPLANALFGSAGSKLSSVNFGSIASAAATVKIPGFAKGTDFAPGGLALVGEHGPELVNLPRGSQVYPSAAMGGITVNVHAKDAVLTHQVRQWVAEGVQIATQGGAALSEARTARKNRFALA